MKYIITDQKKNGYLTGLFFKKDKCYRIYGVENEKQEKQFSCGVLCNDVSELLLILEKSACKKKKHIIY